MKENPVNFEQMKFDVCCAARLLYRQGLSVAIDENTMLVNRFGLSFATLKPENVVRVNLSGSAVMQDERRKKLPKPPRLRCFGKIF